MEISAILKQLNLSEFVAFDFETTGLDPVEDRIIEIAAVRFVDGQITDRFVTLVNPGKQISEVITDITGISNSMVEDAPPEKEVIADFFAFLGNAPLVAHHISFDISFLKALHDRHGRPYVEHKLYDTLQLARSVLFDRSAYNLGSIADEMGLSSSGSHRAEKDAENCGLIFLRLVEETASLPLEVVSKILALIKSSTIPNKALFVDLANVLTARGDLKKGLTESKIRRPVYKNIFEYSGTRDIRSISAEDVFAKEGLLSGVLENYEERVNQIRYAEFVEKIITNDANIGVVEAGTGLGKSLAYLFPALKCSLISDFEGPTIISCHTKHLQDQLFHKDLPLLAKALDVSLLAVILKGRNNYICLTRLNWVIADAAKILNDSEVESLIPILIWVHHTQTGDMSECTGFWSNRPTRVVSLIQSDAGFCTTNLCNKYHGCFFGKVRRAVYDADFIIVNHALLLSEIGAPGILPPYNTIIIDEAHNLIGTAYRQLTIHLDQTSVMVQLQTLDPKYQGNVRWSSVLKLLSGHYPEFEKLRKTLEQNVNDAKQAAKTLFEMLNLNFANRYNINDFYPRKYIIENLAEEFNEVYGELVTLGKALQDLLETIKQLARELLAKDESKLDYPALHQVFEQQQEILIELTTRLATLTSQQDTDWVYWQEGQFVRRGYSSGQLNISLHCAPVDVAKILADKFFEAVEHCVLTSATLQVDDSFDYFLNRSGLNQMDPQQVITRTYPSPFYYEDQVTYLQYGGSISITNNPSALAEAIYNCHKKYNKRIMALFTSYNTLNGVYRALRAKFEGRDLPIYAQVHGTSRYAMIRGMHQSSNGILLGTNAFWEGVDLPGDLLEVLIITKLPFDVPSEPVIRAYSAKIHEQGGNSFDEFSVPECVIKFRQGFGRLIRTTSDEGVFIVLDDRVVTKSYGKHFSAAIPVRMQVFTHLEDLKY
ncbi:MAG: hypothetical protein GXO92_02470 [FCB group bacterium]|nr:hypothetical protein [FCB group bacterium]